MDSSVQGKNLHRLFALLEGTFFSAMFLTDGMIAQMLSMAGYSDTVIGVMLAAMGVSCVLLQPVLGYLCDKFRCYRIIFIVSYSLVALTMPLFFLFSQIRAVAFLYCTVTIALVKSLFIVLDSWLSKIQKQGIALDYGRLRSIGSITYAIAAVLLAQILDRFGNASSIGLYWLIYAAMMVALLRLPDPAPDDSEEKISLKNASRALLGNRRYLLFLLCGFLCWISLEAQLLFNARLVSSLGGSMSAIGVAYFVMAASEFFVILAFTRIADRLGTENVLAVGMIGVALKGLVSWLCPTAGWAVAAQLLQAVSYALVIPGVVRYFGELIPRRYLATAFVLYQTLCTGLAQILFSPAYGALSERYSVGAMLALMGIPSLAGAAILFWAAHRAARSITFPH